MHAPKGRATRPTSDRVREALFSVLGDVAGTHVLDLFAGSGALGIEALSRGAYDATFVEESDQALVMLRRNLAELAVDGEVHRRDALVFLKGASARYDLVFIDPPYSSAPRMGESLTQLLPAVLSMDARIVTESDKRSPLELGLPQVFERDYGDTRVRIHHA